MEIILHPPHRHVVVCRHVLQGNKDFYFSLLEDLNSKQKETTSPAIFSLPFFFCCRGEADIKIFKLGK